MTETIESILAKIPGKTDKIVERDHLTVVLFTTYIPDRGDCYTYWNIIALDKSPKIVWRVNPGKDTVIEGDIVFTNVFVGDDGKLMAYAWKGFFYVIDECNGQISPWRDPEWPPGYQPRPW